MDPTRIDPLGRSRRFLLNPNESNGHGGVSGFSFSHGISPGPGAPDGRSAADEYRINPGLGDGYGFGISNGFGSPLGTWNDSALLKITRRLAK